MPTNYVLIIPGSIGGTQAARTLYQSGGGDPSEDLDAMVVSHYWWDDIQAVAGPILASVLSTIAKIQLTELPTYIEFNLGQTDTGVFDDALMAGETALDPATARAIFVDAFVQIVASLRAAISARSVALGGPAIPGASLPCWVHPLGRRYGFPGLLGWHRVRQAQEAAIRAIPNAFRGPDTYDLELHDGLHNAATTAGQIEQGLRAADCHLIDAFGLHSTTDAAGLVHRIRRGPSIGAVTKVDPVTLRIQIVPEDPSDTILYPTGVRGPLGNVLPNWRFADSAAPITSDGTYGSVTVNGSVVPNRVGNYAHAILATGFTVDPATNIMTVSLSAPIANTPVVYYPFDNLPDFTAETPCFIREAETGRPLQGLYLG